MKARADQRRALFTAPEQFEKLAYLFFREVRFALFRLATVFQNSVCGIVLPAFMLCLDFASKAWNRGEWLRMRRSKSSSSMGANKTAAGLPLRVMMTGPSVSISSR